MRYGIFFENSTAADYGILLPNHLASSIEDSSGDRAQHLSQSLGVPVLAYERPSTARLEKLPIFTIENYRDDVADRARKLNKVLGVIGVEQVIVCGNSSGAIDALAIAASGELPVKGVIAIDPVSLRTVSVSVGIKYAKDQLRNSKTALNDPGIENVEELPDIRRRPSSAELARRIIKEVKVYGPVYRSSLGQTLLRDLATNMPDTPVNLILGENSITTSPQIQREMKEEFAGSSVSIETIPDAGHSFSDPHHHFVYLVKKVINLLPIGRPNLDELEPNPV